jgi:enolase
MAYTISKVHWREVLDSRGNPTVEVELTLSDWTMHRALVPSGASTWVHEALELRDWDKSRFLWKGTLKAVENVNTTIANEIQWKTYDSFRELDKALIALDGTPNKSKLWANAILWVSMAFVWACAKTEWKWIYEYLGNW